MGGCRACPPESPTTFIVAVSRCPAQRGILLPMTEHSSPHRGARRERLGSASPPNDGMPSAIASHENRFLWCSPWRDHRARHALALHSSSSAAAAPFDAETSTDLTVLALSSHFLSRHHFGRRSCAPVVRERRDHREPTRMGPRASCVSCATVCVHRALGSGSTSLSTLARRPRFQRLYSGMPTAQSALC